MSMAEKLVEKVKDETVKAGPGKAGVAGAGAGLDALTGKKAKTGPAALESRFLTLLPGSTVDKTEQNTGRMVGILEKIEKGIKTIADAGKNGGVPVTVQAANFS